MEVPTGRLVHDYTPDLEALTRDVLFGQVWQDDRLSKHDRSLVTIAMLIVQGREGPIKGHMLRAMGHGVTADEIKALITHAAFYGGWGCAEAAVRAMAEMQIGEYDHDKPCKRICCPENQAGAD